jgi:hypothetical protein
VRPGRDADRSPLSIAEVKNEMELYSSPPCRQHGGSRQLYFYYYALIQGINKSLRLQHAWRKHAPTTFMGKSRGQNYDSMIV